MTPLLKSFSLALAASASALAMEIWASTDKVELNADGDVTNCIEPTLANDDAIPEDWTRDISNIKSPDVYMNKLEHKLQTDV